MATDKQRYDGKHRAGGTAKRDSGYTPRHADPRRQTKRN